MTYGNWPQTDLCGKTANVRLLNWKIRNLATSKMYVKAETG